MDSKQSNHGDQGRDPTIKIKVEPCTSTSIASTSIKVEAPMPTTRLTSFRVPRDLTLGGHIKLEKPKKLYTPNLNVQRNKAKDEHATVKNNSRTRERSRGRGQSPRGRGRAKIADHVIQTDGVFSGGIADSDRTGRRQRFARESDNRSSDRQSSSALEKQKLNLNFKFDKAEEEEKLKRLLRDDFIENGAVPNMENAPVMLPMADEARLYKEEFKEEPLVDKVEDTEADVKPVILENGKVSDENSRVHAPPLNKPVKNEKKVITIPQIVENKNNSYILIQFPDCLPGLRTDDELGDPKAKKMPGSGTGNPSDSNPQTEYCTMGSLKEGMLGKLQILKSGQAKLVLGNNKLIMDVGSHVSFRQDLIATKLDVEKLNGELINLGTVGTTLICSPDWESMLANP